MAVQAQLQNHVVQKYHHQTIVLSHWHTFALFQSHTNLRYFTSASLYFSTVLSFIAIFLHLYIPAWVYQTLAPLLLCSHGLLLSQSIFSVTMSFFSFISPWFRTFSSASSLRSFVSPSLYRSISSFAQMLRYFISAFLYLSTVLSFIALFLRLYIAAWVFRMLPSLLPCKCDILFSRSILAVTTSPCPSVSLSFPTFHSFIPPLLRLSVLVFLHLIACLFSRSSDLPLFCFSFFCNSISPCFDFFVYPSPSSFA